MVVPAEDDDVLRERELIQSKPISVLQKDNNLVIKWVNPNVAYLS